jgi:hypothetical protein
MTKHHITSEIHERYLYTEQTLTAFHLVIARIAVASQLPSYFVYRTINAEYGTTSLNRCCVLAGSPDAEEWRKQVSIAMQSTSTCSLL